MHKFSHDQPSSQYSKIPRKKLQEEVYFPLHSRSELTGKDYTSKFEAVSQLKAPLGMIKTQRLKVSIEQDLPDEKETDPDSHFLKDLEDFSQMMAKYMNFMAHTSKVHDYNAQDTLVPIESWKNQGSIPPMPASRIPKNFERIQKKNQPPVYFDLSPSDNWQQKELQKLKKSNNITYLQMKVALELTDWRLRFQNKSLRKIFHRVVRENPKDFPSLVQGISHENPVSMDLSSLGEASSRLAVLPTANHLEQLMADSLRFYSIDNTKASTAIFHTFFTSGSLIETIFTLFPNRRASDFLKYETNYCSKPISEALRLTYVSNLEKFPVTHMRNYFGDKVALYFAFMSYWRDWLVAPAAAGLVYFSIEMVYRSDNRFDDDEGFVEKLYEVASYVFIIFVSVWKNKFLIGWIRYEKAFSASTGDENEEEESANVRNGFSGRHERSVTNDKINSRFTDQKATLIKGILLVMFGLLFVGLTFASSAFLIQAKRYAFNQIAWNYDLLLEDLSLKMVLFDFAEFLRIKLYRNIYFTVIKKLIIWMDLKLIRTHEEMVILTLSTYQVINNSAFILIIFGNQAWANTETDEQGRVHIVSDQCIKHNCGEEAVFFFLSYMIFHLLSTFLYHIIFSGIKSTIQSKAKRMINHARKLQLRDAIKQLRPAYLDDVEKRERHKAEVLKTYQEGTDENRKPSDKFIAGCHLHQDDIYAPLNKEIEGQLTQLENYNLSQNYDETLFYYLEIFNTYSYLILFGGLFSQCFIIAWIIGLLETYLNKNKILYSKRRPIPTSSTSIGLWVKMLRIVTFLGVITNSFYLTIVLLEDKNTWVRLATFVAMVVGLGAIDFYSYRFIAGESTQQKAIRFRRGFIKSLLLSHEKRNRVDHLNAIKTSEKIFSDQSSKNTKTGGDIFAHFFEEAEDNEIQAQTDIELGIMAKVYQDNKHKYQSLPTSKPQRFKNASSDRALLPVGDGAQRNEQ